MKIKAKGKRTAKKTSVKTTVKKKKTIKAKKETVKLKTPKAKKATARKRTAKPAEAKKTIKKETRKIAIKKKTTVEVPRRTLEKIEKKIEYGEDKITLMTVDPWKLFAYWEIRKDTLGRVKGTLALRVYDVTGIQFNGKNANIVFDIAVFEKIGNSYIGVGPARDFIVDIGAISPKGAFATIVRSNKVSTPAVTMVKKEGALVEETYGIEPTIGYF